MERRSNISIGLPPLANFQDPVGEPTGSAQYQSTECVLYGSVAEEQYSSILQRLRGLCDPGKQHFHEHNMCFRLNKIHSETGFDSPVQIQLRRQMNGDNRYWNCRYIGIPEVDPKTPVIVRKTIDSTIYSLNIMEFIKSLGLRLEYEYVVDGYIFSKGNIRVSVHNVEYTDSVGNYQKANMKTLTNSHLVEAIVMLPEGVAHDEAAKRLRDFCDQLMPLCEMRKIDYMKDPPVGIIYAV